MNNKYYNRIRAYWSEYLLFSKLALRNFIVWVRKHEFKILANEKLQANNERKYSSGVSLRYFLVGTRKYQLFFLANKETKESTRIDKQIKNNKTNPHQEILALIYSCGISILSLWRGDFEGKIINIMYSMTKGDEF